MFHTTFYLRRLHSLCGLVVLGMVLFEHIFTNSMAIFGPQGLNTALEMMELIPKPIFMGLELGGIAVPLLFHGIYGIYIALQAKNNPGNYSYTRNINFALQRWTAWFLVVFLIWHVGYLRCYVKGVTGTLSCCKISSRIRLSSRCISSACGRQFSTSATASRPSA